MKICVVSTGVFVVGSRGVSGYSGLEQLAWQQAKVLAEKRHEVSLVAPRGSELPGGTVIPISHGWDERSNYASYWEDLLGFDVIVDHSWNKFSYILKMEGRLKVPILGWMHAPVNTMFQTLPDVEKPCFVCISNDQKAHFEAIHGNVEARVCYNGVNLDHYKALDIPRSNRFLFLARFSTIKGPLISIDAALETNSELDLVGDTSITQEPEYFQQCLSKADGKQIKIIGGISRGETVWWYSQARALLHPNKLFREPFGLAPVEAMACGLPVVAWDYGAMRETVIHGQTGFLCRTVEDFKRAMGAVDGIDRGACREQASKFTEDRMVNTVQELVKEAVDGGGW